MRSALVTVASVTAILCGIGAANIVAHGTDEQYGPMFEPTAPTAAPPAPTRQPKEDDPGFDCRTQGNRICGPGAGFPAGCYRDGVIVIPWTNYTDPKSDPLYGQFTSPC